MAYDGHTALELSLFATYHVISIESKACTVCPVAGFVTVTSLSAWTSGVMSDSRATVETIKAFEVNRILWREYFEVGEKWVGLGEESGESRRL